MRIGPFSVEPRLLTTLAAALFVALLLSLGRWQLNRAGEKEARQALYDARMGDAPVTLTGSVAGFEPLLYRRVRVAGEWIAARQIFIDNQIQQGRAGFNVITPLRLEGRIEAVLVNRGWIPRDSRFPRAPAVAVPTGRVEVTGLATRPPARYRELSADTVTGDVWQNLSIERYAAQSGVMVLPVVVLADAPAPGLAAVREKPDAGMARHYEYAMTWFALAGTVLALWLALNVRRVR
ncbi:MAG: SURF1 family protein [Usitatibacter sp.]